MALTLATATATAGADPMAALCNGGSVKFYTAPRPATANTAITTQVLLATCTFANPAFASAVAGVATAHALTADSDCAASGTAAWARFLTSGAAAVCDGSVGTSGADCNLSSTALVAHGTLTITSCTITVPLG